MTEGPTGKRGTVRLDPSATVPEAIPALRFVNNVGDIATADQAELKRQAEAERASDPRHKNDRKEFTEAVPTRGFRPTVEMGTVDVSRADPRQAPTREVSRLPLVDRGYDPSREDGPPPPPKRSGLYAGVAVAVAGAIVAAYIVVRYAF